MTGEELYKLYAAKQSEINNCRVDVWGRLNESCALDNEQAVWNAMANDINEGHYEHIAQVNNERDRRD